MKKIKFELMDETAINPTGQSGNAGIDLYIPKIVNYSVTDSDGKKESFTNVSSNFKVQKFHQVMIGLKIKSVIDKGFYLQFKDKSGIAVKKGLITMAGVIDSNYEGELIVCFYATRDTEFEVGTKIVQGIILHDHQFDDESEQHNRGTGGFGSTGVK